MICVPIMALNNAGALKKMAKAAAVADIMEIRLDVMETFDLKEMTCAAATPVLVTYRSRTEGGNGSADYRTLSRCLMPALSGKTRVDFVDIEYRLPLELRQEIGRAHV